MLQLFIATVMAAATVLMHLGGISLLLELLRRRPARRIAHPDFIRQASSILFATFGLFALHTAEIWSYAALYWLLGAVTDFEDALYFSTVTYSTIGYGDVTLAKAWRILGAIEGANGIILLGWSTAFFISVVERIKRLEREFETGQQHADAQARLPSG